MPADIWDQAATVGAAPPAAAPAKFVGPVQASAPVPKGDIWDQAATVKQETGTLDGIGAHLNALYEGLKTAPIAHPIDLLKSTLGMVAHPADTLSGDADARKQLYADAAAAFKNGDYGPGFVKGLLSFLPLVGPQLGAPYQEMKDAQAKGDTIGEAKAAGKLLGIAGSAEIARNAPEIIAGAPRAAETAVTAVKGGVDAAKNAATEMTPLRKLGVSVNVPAVAVKSAVGSALGSAIGHPFGLSAEGGGAGAIIGGAGPIAMDAFRGIRDSLADLRAKRAAATQAAQAVADQIKNNVPPEPSPAAAESATPQLMGPHQPMMGGDWAKGSDGLYHNATGGTWTGEGEPPIFGRVAPPSRQLPPASQIQTPPPPNAVADYVPPSGPDTTGQIPTDPETGKPLSMGPAPSLKVAKEQTPPPAPTNELITKQEIAKGLEGKADQGFIDAIYNQIHGIETPAPAKALPPDQSPLLTGELEYHASGPSATPETRQATAPAIAPPPAAPAEPNGGAAVPLQVIKGEMTRAEYADLRDKLKTGAGDLGFDSTNQAIDAIATHPDWVSRWHIDDPEIIRLGNKMAGWPERLESPSNVTPVEEGPAPIKPPASRVVNVPVDPSKQFAPSKLMTEEGLAQYAKDNGIPEDQARTALSSEGYQVIGRAQLNRALHAIGSEMGMDHDTLSDVAKITHRVKSMTQLSQEQMLGLYQDLLDKRSISEPLVNKSEMGTEAAGQPTKAPGNSTSGKTAVPAVLQNNPKALAAAQALSDALREQPQ